MKPETEKKVREIKARARDLKSSYIGEIRAIDKKDADPEDSEIPRVAACVIREGRWLLMVAKKFIDRHQLKLEPKDDVAIKAATKFFDGLLDAHASEVERNEFIYRVPAQFILHLDFLAALVQKFDANVKARIAAIEVEELAEDVEIDQEAGAEV